MIEIKSKMENAKTLNQGFSFHRRQVNNWQWTEKANLAVRYAKYLTLQEFRTEVLVCRDHVKHFTDNVNKLENRVFA